MNYAGTHLDLFSGIGGFALAAQWAGFNTIGFCEKEPYAQKVLIERFGAVLADAAGGTRQRSASGQVGPTPFRRETPGIHPDIFQLEGRQYAGVSLLTGGFPCQPFSHAGKRRGKEDDRHLWPEMLRVIGEARPRWVLGENVAGIIGMELDSVLSDLENIGYTAWPVVIPACAVDARHRRDRVWILAYSDDGGRGAEHGKQQKERPTVADAGGDGDVADTAQSLRHGSGEPRQGRRTESSNGGQDAANPNQSGLQGRNGQVLPERGGERIARPGGSQPAIWPDENEWFIKSGMGRVAHGIPHRSHRLKGLGNAIVPQVAEVILKEIAKTFNHHETIQ